MLIDRWSRRNAKAPFPGGEEQPLRSLAKALSWRVTGSIDTMLLSWLFTGNLSVAVAIGMTEVLTKMVLYYAHERIWNRVPFGRDQSWPMGGKLRLPVVTESTRETTVADSFSRLTR